MFRFLLYFSSELRIHRTKLKIGLLKGKQTSCQLQENNLGWGEAVFDISIKNLSLSVTHLVAERK